MTAELSTVELSRQGHHRQLLVAGDDWLSSGLIALLPDASFDSSPADEPEALVVDRGALSLVSDAQLRDVTWIILIDPDEPDRRRAVSAKAGDRRARITVVPSIAATGAAEHALLLMLALSRTLLADYSAVVDGSWSRPRSGPALAGRTLGIIGLGRSGLALAERALGMGMRVQFFDVAPKDEAIARLGIEACRFDQILAESDIVSLHLPATRDTFRLIDAPELAAMKPTALLINVADGRLIDEGSLIKALRSGDIAGAGLDTFAYEPLSPDSPLIGFENVVLTPRTAWISVEDERKLWLDRIVTLL